MDELCRAVSRGEQCLGYQVFQAAVKECQSGRDGEEEIATAVRGTPELQSLKEEGCVASSRETTSENCRGPSSKEVKTAGVEVALENRELWRQFDRITNEMIVTKAGRRMFPLLQVSITGLVPTATYSILLEFQITDVHRWRFLNGEWLAASASSSSEPPEQRCVYVHPSSPQTGAQWMKEKVTFSKLKLSNKEDGKGKVKLCSLYRYQPCLYIIQFPSPLTQRQASTTDKGCGLTSHVFTETQFVAVTAYQNDKITQMKIKHNPYAKAFQGPQDTIHFTRTSTESMTNTMTTTPHFHQPHLPTLTTLVTPTHQPQATPTHGVLTHNWLPQSTQYLYEGYHAQYHTHPSTQHGHSYYPQHQPLSMSSAGAPPLQMPAGQWVLPSGGELVHEQQQHQQQMWYNSASVSGDSAPLQILNNQVSPLEFHSS